MEKHNVDVMICKLSDYCHHAKKYDALHVSDWINGEGIDVCVDAKNGQSMFSLTHGELNAIVDLYIAAGYELDCMNNGDSVDPTEQSEVDETDKWLYS